MRVTFVQLFEKACTEGITKVRRTIGRYSRRKLKYSLMTRKVRKRMETNCASEEKYKIVITGENIKKKLNYRGNFVRRTSTGEKYYKN